mmetsp:Transcript_25434/g.30162  ORF Transcript_25434/g.30162 Transcript_25434/m.30162 type:complete len:209 (-) Transcript_25434:306-932(-)
MVEQWLGGFLLLLFFSFSGSCGSWVFESVWERVFVEVDVLDNLFDAMVFLQELEGCFGANTRDLITVVTTTKNTEVNELIVGETEPLKKLHMSNLLNGLLLTSRKSELLKEVWSGKSESIHIFSSGSINQTRSSQHCALGLCFTRGFNDWHSHQTQQSLRVFIVFSCDFYQTRGIFIDSFGVITFLSTFEFFSSLRTILCSLSKFSTL